MGDLTPCPPDIPGLVRYWRRERLLIIMAAMKITVFSDVQGNLPAMEVAVAHIRDWRPDLVVMNGDLVNRGPASDACLDLFRTLQDDEGWLPLRGNHEDYVLHCDRHPPHSSLDRAMRRFADWTAERLGGRLEALRKWPDHLCLQGPGDTWVHITHGSLLGNRDGISASVPDERLAQRVPEDTDLFVVAHTHKPLERDFRGTRILNVGSVGSPFDGDPRASYGQIEYRDGRWRMRIIRLAYDRQRTERDFHESGFLEQGGPLAEFIYQEWLRASLMMPLLRARYLQPIVQGEMALEQAVQEFLRNL